MSRAFRDGFAGGAIDQYVRVPLYVESERPLEVDVRAAQQVERELRDLFASQAALLAQAQSQCSALQPRLDNLERQLCEEKKSHEGTRVLLATALAHMRKSGSQRRIRKTK